MKFRSFFMSMFAIAALASCNNDDEIPGGTQDEQGKAWIGVNVSLPAGAFGGTRAVDTNDSNAEDVETTVNTISVYLENAGTLTGYEKVAELTKASFEGPVNGEYTSKEAVEVIGTAGDVTRRLFVVINEPEGFDAAKIQDGVYTADITKLAQANKFVMFNSKEVFAKLCSVKANAEAADSTTTVAMERLAAKALLTTTLDFTQAVPDEGTEGDAGSFVANSLKWRIRMSNTKMYHIKKNDYKSPNWGYTAGVTTFEDYTEYPWGESLITVPAQNAAPATGYTAEGAALVQYFTENTNESYLYENTTVMAIQAEFIPRRIVTGYTAAVPPSTEPEWEIDEANATLQTFWYAVKDKKYMTEAGKNAFLAANPDEAENIWGPYADGVCYYYVSLGELADGKIAKGTKRNTYYKANVKSLIAPGRFEPPTGSIDPKNVWINVDLEIEPWKMVSMGDLDLQ